MCVLSIEFPTPLTICDIYDDNIDAFITLDDNTSYCVTIATIKWIEKEVRKKGFLEAGAPSLIVEVLDKDIIKKALMEYAEDDAYWLKVLSLSIGDNLIVSSNQA